MTPPDPRTYYTETLPAQFNRALEAQERDAAASDEARRVLEGMRGVDATLRIDVLGVGSFFLNVAGGRMTAGDVAAQPLLLTLVQDLAAFERVVAEAGDSAMGMLGGLSGLAGEMKLTRGRIENLAGVRGLLRFEVTGPEGFALLTHFGPDPLPPEPNTTIQVDPDAYRELRSGAIDPQAAFMSGKIKVAGDLQLAMQLALAALSPE